MLLCALTACRQRSELWDAGLADAERKIDAAVAESAAQPSRPFPTDSPNSMVARLKALGRQNDQEQAAAIRRGIDSAVIEQAERVDAAAEMADGPGPGIERIWGLPELASMALEGNPATRESWQRARAAAAREQKALAAYGPQIGVEAGMSYSQQPFLSQTPQPLPDREARFSPQVYASWLLLDFGRRDADTDRSRAELAAANMSHDRTIQRTVFAVQSAYFRLEGALGLRAAAEQDVIAARSVLQATESRLALGLATRPDMLVARQGYAEALYQLEKRRSGVLLAEGDLRTSVGIPASVALPIDSTPEAEVPDILTAGIDGIIDQALARRPDLAAVVLEVRAREADMRRAQADYLPEVVVRGTAGESWLNFDTPGFSIQGQGWGFAGSAYLGGRWLLFDDGARDAALAEATANRAAASAKLAKARLDAADEVWRAYYTLQSDRAQYDAAKAQLVAAIDAFESVKRAYELGLTTLPELLESERNLSLARAQRIESRSSLLTSSANLVFASGAGPGEVR
jgi:outer membrane protein TolC